MTTMSFPTNRRSMLQLIGAGAIVSVLPELSQAQGQTKITLGYTAVGDFACAFAAKEEGYFERHGLDVELKLIPLNPSLPPAIESDSLQVGGPTPSVFLQAIDGGLDHVVVSGCSVASRTMAYAGVVAKPDSPIKNAQDLVGRRVGVPGLGALLHVAARAWIKSQGVDYNKVTFVEAPFPQHADLLRGGSVDAVVTADPFMSRITGAGLGRSIVDFTNSFFPEGLPTLMFAAKRDWVRRNAAAAKGFRDAIADGAAFVNQPANSAKAREYIGRYIKLPPEVLATIKLSQANATVAPQSLQWWVDAMTDQKMLRNKPDLARLLSA